MKYSTPKPFETLVRGYVFFRVIASVKGRSARYLFWSYLAAHRLTRSCEHTDRVDVVLDGFHVIKGWQDFFGKYDSLKIAPDTPLPKYKRFWWSTPKEILR
jgi:hypothetical protein